MNVNQIEIYDNFVALSNTYGIESDNTNNDVKNFILKNNVNDLILNYESVVGYSESLNNTKDKQDFFMNSFYESVSDFIMKNNFSTITNIKNIFLIFPYLSPNKTYELITYLYPLVTSNIQEYFHYDLLIILYTIMVHKEIIHMNNIWDEYYIILNKLYVTILKNPVYSTKEEKENDEYTRISLFDIFVHISYVNEKYDISLIFLKLILNQMEKMSNEEFMNFHSTTVNIDSLYTLYENVNGIGFKYIKNIEKDENDNDIYRNKIMYFVNNMVSYMKRKNVTEVYKLENKNIIYYMTYYFEHILYNSSKKENHYFVMNTDFDPCEVVHIIGDLFRVNNSIFYELFIDSFNKSINMSKPTKVFILSVWMRYIYYVLNKNNNLPVAYDDNIKKYYFNVNGNKKILLYTDYINDIISYMNYIKESQLNIYEFLIENIKQFVLYDYDEMIEKCNSCEDKNCSICLENVESTNMNICLFCNKLFHDSCIIKLWKSGHDHCPLCRRNINVSHYIFSRIRYEFFKDILDKMDE